MECHDSKERDRERELRKDVKGERPSYNDDEKENQTQREWFLVCFIFS